MARRFLIIAIVAILAGGAFMVAATQGVWGRLTNTVRVNNMARAMADFDLPAGYEADYAVEVLGYSIAAYKAGEGGHLVFLQVPQEMPLNEQALTGFVASQQRNTEWSKVTTINTQEQTVRAGTVTVTTSERQNGAGQLYHQLNTIFEGRNGPVLLVINQRAESWDEASVDAFLRSIR